MDTENDYGFNWGQVSVTRAASFPRDGGTCKVLMVRSGNTTLEIYVSPTGRSVRVFKNHKEMRVEHG